MVLTHPDFRRRGFASHLVRTAIERADALKIPSIKLDATEDGRPLYEAFGFRAEQPVERWQKAGDRNASFSGKSVLADRIADLDGEACGYDRMGLLQGLAERSSFIVEECGYALTRPGRIASYIGPMIAGSKDIARRMITAKKLGTAAWFWDLLPTNTEAVALACELGFAPVRRLTRMVRGEDLRGNEQHIYAIAGFELG